MESLAQRNLVLRRYMCLLLQLSDAMGESAVITITALPGLLPTPTQLGLSFGLVATGTLGVFHTFEFVNLFDRDRYLFHVLNVSWGREALRVRIWHELFHAQINVNIFVGIVRTAGGGRIPFGEA